MNVPPSTHPVRIQSVRIQHPAHIQYASVRAQYVMSAESYKSVKVRAGAMIVRGVEY